MTSGSRLKQQRRSLGRFLAYVLGRRPDEFGLFVDEEGWLPIKELLQALSEEEGWRHVRRSHIDDVLREPDQPGIEIKDKLIRLHPGAGDLTPGPPPEAEPPKLLYHAARRKAYPAILEHGLRPGARPYVPLADTEDLALRIGRRRDPDPVLLTILAEKAAGRVAFRRPLEHVYLVEGVPPDLFTGPPLPKEKPAPAKKPKAPPPAPERRHPGSFFLESEDVKEKGRSRESKKKKKGDSPDWKVARKKDRRRKGKEEF